MPNAKNLEERLTQAFAMNARRLFTPPVIDALKASFPMLLYIAQELEWTIDFTGCQQRQPITTKFVFTFSLSRLEKLTGSDFSFMDTLWQYNNPPNPSDAAIGPQAYDHHLYYRLVLVPLCVDCNRIDVSTLSM